MNMQSAAKTQAVASLFCIALSPNKQQIVKMGVLITEGLIKNARSAELLETSINIWLYQGWFILWSSKCLSYEADNFHQRLCDGCNSKELLGNLKTHGVQKATQELDISKSLLLSSKSTQLSHNSSATFYYSKRICFPESYN